MPRILDCPTSGGSLRVRVADSFASRALGLLIGPALAPDEALLICPCSSIHTIGMRYPIDVVFLDRQARIVRVFASVRAGRFRLALGARAALELRAGAAVLHGLTAGVRLPKLENALAAG